MRTGVILPIFRDTPDDAFATAEAAVDAGVDGLFCYDHLWPLGQPERPALAPFPILGALAARFAGEPGSGEGVFLGTMVARIGLVPNSVLVDQFMALEHLAPERVIAGLGTGDRLGKAENIAYGIPYPPASVRRADMEAVARTLVGAGLTVWLAGGPARRADEARATGAALNVWDADPALVSAHEAEPGPLEVTWAGPPPGPDMAEALTALARAGVTWTVVSWPVDLAELVESGRAASRWSGRSATA